MNVLVEEELDHLECIIEPIAFLEWALPFIAVLKVIKISVRICRDFKSTVNKASKLDRYTIPRVEDMFVSLASYQTFTKLDLS